MVTSSPIAGTFATQLIRDTRNLRSSIEDLERQLGTGQRSETYGGLGRDANLVINFQQRLSNTEAYLETINLLTVRSSVIDTTLERISAIGQDTQGLVDANEFTLLSDGRTGAQRGTESLVAELIGLLNSEVGGRYIFGGSATDAPPVTDLDTILNGNGTQAGLRQIISERQQADLGADGKGRLVVSSPSAGVVDIAEDADPSPFGFKVNSISTSSATTTVSGPSGTPESISVDFTNQPVAGNVFRVKLDLPDGTSETVELKATIASPAPDDSFTIGATPTDTATNFTAALNAKLVETADRKLVAASSLVAGENFFNTANGAAPQRVSGSPLNTSTALVDGTTTNTVEWYKGENSAGVARESVSVRVDDNVVVDYGIRANEEGLRELVQDLAVFIAQDFSAGGATEKSRYDALANRLDNRLADDQGEGTVNQIRIELAAAFKTADVLKERHTAVRGTLLTTLEEKKGVDLSETVVSLRSLQTRLQASFQASATLLELRLTNFLR
ncbi:flagellar biosynthesis protein FlgL [Coralliovum pocilloporae]|uniref:flagellar biosynthesis protein FlgL n=1 Tax=Coralliovum pocilloporae TaxID=3066369 RepID=UPI003306E5C6